MIKHIRIAMIAGSICLLLIATANACANSPAHDYDDIIAYLTGFYHGAMPDDFIIDYAYTDGDKTTYFVTTSEKYDYDLMLNYRSGNTIINLICRPNTSAISGSPGTT